MPDSDDRTCEKIDKLTDAVNGLSERMARVETKLENGSKKNGSLDTKTWAIIIAMLLGGGAANYGLQSAVQGEPQVQFLPAPQMTYTQPRPNVG